MNMFKGDSPFGVKKICLFGGGLRLLMLAIILAFGNEVSIGLMGSTILNDDVRYVEIAKEYAKSADFVIDVSAFVYSLDTIEFGYIHTGFEELWYWITCVLFFVLRYDVLVRVVNILFSIVCVKSIYDICNNKFGSKCAIIASMLYACMPYPVFFSCFLYKDQFYTMITLLLIRKALDCAGNMKLKDMFVMALLLFVSMWTRSGLVVLVAVALIVIIFKEGHYGIGKSTTFFLVPIAIALTYYLVWISIEAIQRKTMSYVFDYTIENTGDTINFFSIKSWNQIWKYPLSLAFLLFQPLNLSAVRLTSWINFAGYLNILIAPIAIANLLYLFSFKMKKSYLYWIVQLFYLITIVTSLGIVRHQFYLQPFMMIIAAVFICRCRDLFLWKVSSVGAVLAIVAIFFFHM